LNLSVLGPPRYRTRLGALKYRFLKNTASSLPQSEVLALFQNWMDNSNDVELSVSKLTNNSVNRDDISIKDLAPADESAYFVGQLQLY